MTKKTKDKNGVFLPIFYFLFFASFNELYEDGLKIEYTTRTYLLKL